MKIFRITLFLIITFISSLSLSAQEKIEITEEDYANSKVEMADSFRADGKIYVVVAVILVILGGMFFYLYQIDRRLKKIENESD